ncbi:MAG: ISL3 family transposase [Firmicutes bacterium]|nr:ISL3 family transposase [Bacillota bacterium]
MFSNEKLFEIALNLQEPWYVKRIEFDTTAGELHMYIDFRKGSRFPCPVCGQGTKVHDTLEQTWRHLNFFQYKAFIHSRTPRADCPADGVRLVNVPWSRPGSEFTLLFEALALVAQMPVAAVARIVDEHDTRLWRVVHHYVDMARAAEDHSQVRNIAIDETACLRGQRYIALFHDTDAGRVLYAVPGREAFTVGCFVKDLEAHHGKPGRIENVVCDMSAAFLYGVEAQFTNATIVIDKFHLMKLMNEALDEMRRQEQQEVEDLKHSRYIWLKNQSNLTAAQRRLFEDLSQRNLKTARAYRMKLALQEGYQSPDRATAEEGLKRLYWWLVHSRLEPMKAMAVTIKGHWNAILNYFDHRRTTGALEAARNRARGYRNVNNLITMVYPIAGKLRLSPAEV